jgi:hypothetical protein
VCPATGHGRETPISRTYRLRCKYLSEVNACDAMNDAAALEDPDAPHGGVTSRDDDG